MYFSGFNHYGVVVTTVTGKRWLIHKGFGFSKRSHSVIVDAKHMSNRWKLVEKKKVNNVKIKEFMKAAGKFFHPVYDNAFHAAVRMMKLGRRP